MVRLLPLFLGTIVFLGSSVVPRAEEGGRKKKVASSRKPETSIKKEVRKESIQDLKKRIDELNEKLKAIQDWKEEQELESLKQSAESAAIGGEEESFETKTYIQAVRSLQAQNPEISVAGDLLFGLAMDEDFERFYISEDDRSGLPIRALDLHMQSSLDPFSLAKMAMTYEPYGSVWIEEMYVSWQAVIPRFTLNLGRFRQLLGVVNRWHQHDLEQTDYPLPILEFFGPNGLYQDGVSVTWHMPAVTAHANELTVQVTDGTNERIFSGKYFSVPSVLTHFKNYYDLNEDTYFELGLTGMFGVNNMRGYTVESYPGRMFDEPWRNTWVGAADLTLNWEPLNRAKYRGVTWRTEYFFVSKETQEGEEQGWGAYSYLQAKLSPQWQIGFRGDVVEPLERSRHGYEWMVVPYVTFLQSEFVYMRLEAQYGQGFPEGARTRILLQINFAAGPHKHEKY